MYKDKYIKYKKKYLELQNQLGGLCQTCPKMGFQQYLGSCLHDSLSTILLYSDNLSENIQKIFDIIIENFVHHSDFDKTYFDTNGMIPEDKFIQYYNILLNLDKTSKDYLGIHIKKNKDIFLPLNISPENLQYFIDESLHYLYNVFRRYINDKKDKINPIKRLHRQNTNQENKICRNHLANIININIIEKIQEYTKELDNYIVINIFNYFLLDCEKEFINYSSFFLNKEKINKDSAILFKEYINKCFNIGLLFVDPNNIQEPAHQTSFIKCNNTEYYYDNNGIYDINGENKLDNTTFEFEWKTFLINICDDIISGQKYDMSLTYSDIFTTEILKIKQINISRYRSTFQLTNIHFLWIDKYTGEDLRSNYYTDNIFINIYSMRNHYNKRIYDIVNYLLDDDTLSSKYLNKKNYFFSNLNLYKLFYDRQKIIITQYLAAVLSFKKNLTLDEFKYDILNSSAKINYQHLLYFAIDGMCNINIIEYILDKDKDNINKLNTLRDNLPPLNYAIYKLDKTKGTLSEENKNKIYDIIDFLINKGANLHYIDSNSNTRTVLDIVTNPKLKIKINDVIVADLIMTKDSTTFKNIKDKICDNIRNNYNPTLKAKFKELC